MGAIANLISGGSSGGYDKLIQQYPDIIKQLQDYYQQGTNYIKPFHEAGVNALPKYDTYLQDVKDLGHGKWMQDYKQSPYAKYLTDVGANSMNNAAAASGALGSGANQQDNAQMAEDIANKDMNQYFNNEMEINKTYGAGLNNLINTGANAADTGAHMSMNAGQDVASLRQQQAKAQMDQQIAKNSAKNSAISALIGSGDISSLTGGKNQTWSGL